MELEDLPPALVVEILSRLSDSTDLARCRLSSRTLRSLSYGVRSVVLRCSRHRFLRSRSPEARHLVLPFRSVAANLAALLAGAGGGALEFLSLAVDRPSGGDGGEEWEEEEFDDADDLHLTAGDFLARWLPLLAPGLKSLAISDYWVQSCWRRSEALAIISNLCNNLVNLEVRSAWLSVEGLKPMPKLTSLTLEYIRLDDEDLMKLNECFPSLQVLNLIGVGGLREPKIHLPQLKICYWTVSNFPRSLTIKAPNLIELKLKCVEPAVLVLEAPLLSDLKFMTKKPSGVIRVEKFRYLKYLRVESSDICNLMRAFVGNQNVKTLELEVLKCSNSDESIKTVTFGDLLSTFPQINYLKLGSGAWCELQKSFGQNIGIALEALEWRRLKKLMVDLPHLEFDIKYISFLLNFCIPSCEVVMLFHDDATTATRKRIVSQCTNKFPNVRWKWGMQKEFFE